MSVAAAADVVPEPFTVDPDQEAFRGVVRSFLRTHSAEAAVRSAMDSELGYDPDVWKRLAGQLGLAGLIVPAEYGGSGMTDVELGIAMEEMGRALLCSPFLSTAVLAPAAVLAADDADAAAELLPAIAAGERTATLAIVQDAPPWAGGTVTVTATDDRLTGTVRYVLDGASAGLVLLLATTPDGPTLYAVDGTAAGVTRTPLQTLDLTRRQADLDLVDVPGRRVGRAGDGSRIVTAALYRTQIALAAEQVGAAQAVLADAVEYSRTRIQFGVPIGSFQAIKHRCATTLVEVESARSVAGHAAWVAAHDPDDLAVSAHLASAYCSEAFTTAAMSNVQVHGGIGFTWEHSAHLYLKRAKASEVLLGSPRYHRRALADRIGL